MSFDITYHLEPVEGEPLEITVRLDEETFALIPPEMPNTLPEWANLDHHQCPHCPLDPKTMAYCPVAVNFAYLAPFADKYWSYHGVKVTVTTPNRSYAKTTDAQAALASLLGLMGATSGCPTMHFLRPMARFHLPFSSIEETTWRILSTYAVAQFYRQRDGGEADLTLDGLKDSYAELGQLNEAMADRLTTALTTDANVNALVSLDIFAKMAMMTFDSNIDTFRDLLTPYFKDRQTSG